jgi:demethylmenaquinone methyltransferase/2-methoxy-6-polyprenyl-1,4-benzoquinol methylase
MQPHPILPQHYRTAEEKPAFVQHLFDAGAPYYDRTVGWGSLGTGTMYRKMAERRAGIKSGIRLLDAAAGTGLMTEAAIALGVSPQDIVCLDPSPGMLAVAREKFSVNTVIASADDIPQPDGSFDFVTMGYALRHVASLEGTFREFFRVLRPGGKLLILEITKPSHRVGAWWFRLWFRDVYPALTRLFTRNRDAQKMMRYYWETMDAVVPPESILQAMHASGFSSVHRHVVGRIFSEYTGVKAAPAAPPSANGPHHD